MNAQALVCQIKGIADFILRTEDFTAAELRLVAVELRDTIALVESEILRLDGKAQCGKRALRQLLTGTEPPKGAA
jgi:hypothetical protein